MNNIEPITNSIRNENHRLYVDITTRNINTGATGVYGTNSDFTLKNISLPLDSSKKYTVKVDSLIYKNVNVAADAFLTVLSDIGEEIIVNNKTSSILYRSNIPLSSTDYIIRDSSNNSAFKLPLKSTTINSIRCVSSRSDNGALVALDVASTVTIILLIEEE